MGVTLVAAIDKIYLMYIGLKSGMLCFCRFLSLRNCSVLRVVIYTDYWEIKANADGKTEAQTLGSYQDFQGVGGLRPHGPLHFGHAY